MSSQDLSAIAQALVAEGKGILAADETVRTVTKRLAAAGIESTADSRRAYRQMFFTTPEIASFISGVILQDETIRQSSSFGTALVTVLAEQGILPGIKVDNGATPLAGSPGETITEGLDGLRERLEEYLEMGARFAKWRAVIHVSDVAVPAEARSRGGAGNRVSLRRAQSPRCDGASERHQSSRRTEAGKLSFSYGRALQDEALTLWRGHEANLPAAQHAFLHRAECEHAAAIGKYTSAMESVSAARH